MKNFILALLAVVVLCGVAQAAPPVATSSAASCSTAGATLLQLIGSDPDGTALTFAIVDSPAHGTLSGLNASSGSVVFTPTSGYTGTDSFTFTVTSGGVTTSPATVSLTITNAKTRIVAALIDPAGNPRAGKVTFILTQKANSPGGLITPTGTVSSALNGSGQYDVSVYPSTSLSPQAYYQVMFKPAGSLRDELIGVYNVPASTTTLTTLEPHRVTNTNLAAQYTFVDSAAMNSILSLVSGAANVYTGTPTNNVVQKHDTTSGKLKDSTITDTGSTVTVNTTSGMVVNASSLNGSAALQVDSTTRGLLPPRLTTTQRDAISSPARGLFIYNTTTDEPEFWNTGAWVTHVASVFGRYGTVIAQNGDYSFSQISGVALPAQLGTGTPAAHKFVGGDGAWTFLVAGDIPPLDAAKVTTGAFDPTRLGTGTPAAGKFVRGDGAWAFLLASDIPTLSATKITTDTFDPARLATGTPSAGKFVRYDGAWAFLEAGDIPSLPATIITSSVFNPARLGTGSPSSSNFLRGDGAWAFLTASDIPNLPATRITSSVFDPARLGSGSASSSTILRGDNTWQTPASFGLIDGSGVADRLSYWIDSNTLASSPLVRISGDETEHRGTGGATKFAVSAGYASPSSYTRGVVDANTSVVNFGVERAGLETPVAVRLSSFAGGQIQFNNGSIVAEMTEDAFQPHVDNAYDLGASDKRWKNLNAVTVNGIKKYAALFSQHGATAPTVTVLENSLGGTVVWEYTSAGRYVGTLEGAFPEDKVSDGVRLITASSTAIVNWFRIDGDSIRVQTYDAPAGSATDNLLANTYLEIVIYP